MFLPGEPYVPPSSFRVVNCVKTKGFFIESDTEWVKMVEVLVGDR